MNPASKTSLDTNPTSVLRSISGNNGFQQAATAFASSAEAPEAVGSTGHSEVPVQQESATQESALTNKGATSQLVSSTDVVASDLISHVDVCPQGEVIALRINPESHPSHAAFVEAEIENTIESAIQIQQLAKMLHANETELKNREQAFEKRMRDWHASFSQTVLEQQNQFELRMSQLQQQASNVRCQQLHLMQLQTDIVKSHEASRAAIELLITDPESDAKTIETLQSLKHQLSGRFDYIARRWEHLAELMKNTRVESMARERFNDVVDWTDEAA